MIFHKMKRLFTAGLMSLIFAQQSLSCVIVAQVSSTGHVINVDHLQYIYAMPGEPVKIYQYYNPYVIVTDWSVDQIVDSIIAALEAGCKGEV